MNTFKIENNGIKRCFVLDNGDVLFCFWFIEADLSCFCSGFFFILYSTFLTRSGILGETSVHAFTEMGLENQLLFFILFFLFFPLVVFFIKQKSIPSIEKEEALASKEFWMFIGSLVLLFSACLITASTSLPVYNKIVELFDPTFEGYVIQ